jgi:hypothetical protein
MRRIAIPLAAAALLAAPGVAAAEDYRGKTSQRLKASARVDDGRLKLLKISWRARCEHSGSWRDRTFWRDRPEGPIEHEGSRFTDSGTVTQQFEDGRAEHRQKLSGEILDGRIKGKMTVRSKLYSTDGEHVNSCRATIFFNLPEV